jgi:argininosuccinate lyase
MFRDATRTVMLVAATMRGASFDVSRMAARAGEGGTTMTELADTLARDEGLPFRTAHSIAAMLLKLRTEDPTASLSQGLAKASEALVGRTIDYTENRLQTIMSPRHFVEVRRTSGGPAPEETARAITQSRRVLDCDRSAWRLRRDHLDTAERKLTERVREL